MKINKKLYYQIIDCLKASKDFYERVFETEGDCDHSVGICTCGDKLDLCLIDATLDELIKGEVK